MLHCGDNLEILRSMDSKSVDLIYLDPPFCSQRDYGEFDDRWKHTDEESTIVDHRVNLAIEAASIHSAGMQSYLIFMAVRLLEMNRILKPTGSIYLHCDDTAGAYLKLLMDAVFGKDNCKAQITGNGLIRKVMLGRPSVVFTTLYCSMVVILPCSLCHTLHIATITLMQRLS